MFFAAYPNHYVNQNSKRDELKSFEGGEESRQTCVCKWPLIISTTILLMLFLTFLITFIIFPLIFKSSSKLQKDFIFSIGYYLPGKMYLENYFEFKNFQKHGICGIRNLYVSLQNKERITLGVWHILPEALVQNASLESFDYNEALLESKLPVLLYFHGGVGTRITYVNSYKILRKFFHVIAFDYRCYGDSSSGELSESDIVNDSITLYKWLRLHTKAEIYFWGYSLGSLLTSHTVANLKNDKLYPMGLFLEAPFPTIKEQVRYQMSIGWLTKLLTFMPWFEMTMLKPFDDHGFNYNTTKYISDVDCPIAIIHAQDDTNVPFFLGFQLYDRLQHTRNSKQGNVSFYALNKCYDAETPNISSLKLIAIIRQHLNVCRQYKLG